MFRTHKTHRERIACARKQVYKVVSKESEGLFTLCRHMRVELGKNYYVPLKTTTHLPGVILRDDTHYFVSEFTCFEWKIYAEQYIREQFPAHQKNMLIVKCYIPKGSSYYVGTCVYNMKCLITDNLTYGKIERKDF